MEMEDDMDFFYNYYEQELDRYEEEWKSKSPFW